MNKHEKELFLLLKSALWGDESIVRSVHDVDWDEIYKLAKEQCLVGVVADAFRFLNEEQCSRDERLRWLAYVLRLERKNGEMNLLVGKLFKKFHRMRLSPVLLKGQAFATNYPFPLHRQCGDIDIYFKNRADCEKAVAWAAKVDVEAAESSDNKRERKHFAFSVEGNVVELHYYMCLFENGRLQRRLQKIIDEEFLQCSPFLVDIAEEQIESVPPTLSLLHQIIHIARHLLEAGIGLRQLCDLALYLDKHFEEVDQVKLSGYLKELQLSTVARAMGDILVKYLGMDKRKLPFATDNRYSDFIISEIFEGGNFGKKRVEYRSESDGLQRKLQSISYFYKRCQLYQPLMPSESKSYFWNKIRLNIKLLIKHHY